MTQEANQHTDALEFYHGVLETLEALRDRGTPMGVVTNLPGWLVTTLTKATGIEDYFDSVVTPRIGVLAKPHPHGIRRALGAIGREADPYVWFVGDQTADARAATAAGVRFAWASYGYETVPPTGTERVLPAFEGVLTL